MSKENILFAVTGLLLGVIVTWATSAAVINYSNGHMMNPGTMQGMMGAKSMHEMMEDDMESAMDGMLSDLKNKSGDAFDEAFLEQMIVHHEGAVKMAEEALKNSKREEIKDLSKAIISSQNKEIADMQNWLRDWFRK